MTVTPLPPDVSPSYVHRDKHIVPRPGLAPGGTRLKWYNVAVPEMLVPPAIEDMARAFLMGEGGALAQLSDLGFVVLHRCGESFYFLIVCSWRGNNEIWETVYAKDASDAGFALFPRPGPHLPTFCVWELGAVWHEQQAWRRYLISGRSKADRAVYLADRFEGTV